MKKALSLGLIAMLLVTSLLAACSGTPKAPVSKQIDLDKLVADNMTIDQVYALMKPALKATSVLYQASSITETAGSWSVNVPEGGIASGTTADYQVIFFNPEKGKSQYYAIFLKANICIGKAWFDNRGGPLMEKVLKGEKVTQ